MTEPLPHDFRRLLRLHNQRIDLTSKRLARKTKLAQTVRSGYDDAINPRAPRVRHNSWTSRQLLPGVPHQTNLAMSTLAKSNQNSSALDVK